MERAILGGETSHYFIDSPLSMYICEYVPIVKRTIPKMTHYNGKGDLYENVTYFERHMRLDGYDEITMCQMLEVT